MGMLGGFQQLRLLYFKQILGKLITTTCDVIMKDQINSYILIKSMLMILFISLLFQEGFEVAQKGKYHQIVG